MPEVILLSHVKRYGIKSRQLSLPALDPWITYYCRPAVLGGDVFNGL
jgi:hypothetical protein